MDALQKFSSGLAAIQEALTEFAQLKDTRVTELNLLSEQLTATQANLNTLADTKSTEQKAYIDNKQANSDAMAAQEVELDELQKEIKAASSTLAATTKRHTQFVDYQVRATKILESREASILEREEQLEGAISTAKRRHAILDNI